MIKVSDWDSGTNLEGKLFGYIVWSAIDKRLTPRLGKLEKYNQSPPDRKTFSRENTKLGQTNISYELRNAKTNR